MWLSHVFSAFLLIDLFLKQKEIFYMLMAGEPIHLEYGNIFYPESELVEYMIGMMYVSDEFT